MNAGAPLATLMLTADPQIGLYRSALRRAEQNRAALEGRGAHDPAFDDLPALDGDEREALLFGEAIEAANALRPDALVVCGDLVQDWNDDGQARLAQEIAAGLDPAISLLWVAGNHDIAPDTREPTVEALARYRRLFGDDRYVVEIGGVRLIVLNSTVLHGETLPDEGADNLGLLEAELSEARRAGQEPVVCSHHPWFLREPSESAEEAESLSIPPEPRRRLLEIAAAGGLRTLLTGHLHQHRVRQAGKLLQLTTSSIGLPFGRDASGYQVVRVDADRVEHEPRDLPSGPALLPEAQRIWAARQYEAP
jgi:3',5'-cyclic AMP phosphodiesterase CpdA